MTPESSDRGTTGRAGVASISLVRRPQATDPYEILGVPRGAGDTEIAAAYRALARRHHPDIAGDAATPLMMRINAAFDAIRTAERRSAFDTLDGLTRGGLRWSPERDGTGGAGPPPGRPSGPVLDFGRHIGWSIGEIARVDPGYLVWLSERREGRPYLAEIDAELRRLGIRTDPESRPDHRRPR